MKKLKKRVFEILTQSEDEHYTKVIKLMYQKKYRLLKSYIIKEDLDLDSPKDAVINFLTYAIKNEDLKAVKILVGLGANVNYQYLDGFPIIDSIHLSSHEMLHFLFNSGLDLNNKSGENALYGTLCDDYLESAKLFLLNGAPYKNIDWECEEIKPHIKEKFQAFIEKNELDATIKGDTQIKHKVKI